MGTVYVDPNLEQRASARPDAWLEILIVARGSLADVRTALKKAEVDFQEGEPMAEPFIQGSVQGHTLASIQALDDVIEAIEDNELKKLI